MKGACGSRVMHKMRVHTTQKFVHLQMSSTILVSKVCACVFACVCVCGVCVCVCVFVVCVCVCVCTCVVCARSTMNICYGREPYTYVTRVAICCVYTLQNFVCVCTTLPPLENARALLTTGLDKFSSSPSRPTKGGKKYT